MTTALQVPVKSGLEGLPKYRVLNATGGCGGASQVVNDVSGGKGKDMEVDG